jgi:hypothetical protein
MFCNIQSSIFSEKKIQQEMILMTTLQPHIIEMIINMGAINRIFTHGIGLKFLAWPMEENKDLWLPIGNMGTLTRFYTP